MKSISKALLISAILVMAVMSVLSVTPLASADTMDDGCNCQVRRAVITHIHRRGAGFKVRAAVWFFRGAVGVTIDGNVAAHYRNILILTSEDENINIILPFMWRVGSEVMNVSALFENGYLEVGDDVSVSALQRTVTNRNGTSLTIILAYEIDVPSKGLTLHAVLPFNIKPSE